MSPSLDMFLCTSRSFKRKTPQLIRTNPRIREGLEKSTFIMALARQLPVLLLTVQRIPREHRKRVKQAKLGQLDRRAIPMDLCAEPSSINGVVNSTRLDKTRWGCILHSCPQHLREAKPGREVIVKTTPPQKTTTVYKSFLKQTLCCTSAVGFTCRYIQVVTCKARHYSCDSVLCPVTDIVAAARRQYRVEVEQPNVRLALVSYDFNKLGHNGTSSAGVGM